MQIDQILTAAVRGGASDVVLKTGSVPRFRFRGELLAPENGKTITPELMMMWLQQMLPGDKLDIRREKDFAYQSAEGHRFRINVFLQRGVPAIVARVVLGHIRTIEELQLPPVIKAITQERRGLVLVTGATGSGKSTTMAAMIDRINRDRAAHIITIEDPIEYLLRDELSVIEQREVGSDTESFSNALRAAMRQNPDVIMVGELRDRETVETALRAAETGHLVISTLHTADAVESLTRISGMFRAEEAKNVRMSLASSLKAVVSQRLVPRADGKSMIATVEVLMGTSTVREQIRDATDFTGLRQLIRDGRDVYGMQSFDDSLATLVTSGMVRREDALKYASSKSELELRLAGVGQ
jgi:twitching motility protein PilT